MQRSYNGWKNLKGCSNTAETITRVLRYMKPFDIFVASLMSSINASNSIDFQCCYSVSFVIALLFSSVSVSTCGNKSKTFMVNISTSVWWEALWPTSAQFTEVCEHSLMHSSFKVPITTIHLGWSVTSTGSFPSFVDLLLCLQSLSYCMTKCWLSFSCQPHGLTFDSRILWYTEFMVDSVTAQVLWLQNLMMCKVYVVLVWFAVLYGSISTLFSSVKSTLLQKSCSSFRCSFANLNHNAK